MNEITVTGLIATNPRHVVTKEGVPFTTFRLASYVYDENGNTTGTNWYTFYSEGNLAVNVINSVNKGDRIIVSGIVRVKDWQSDITNGITVEIVAKTVGHDFNYGTAKFSRRYIKGEN